MPKTIEWCGLWNGSLKDFRALSFLEMDVEGVWKRVATGKPAERKSQSCEYAYFQGLRHIWVRSETTTERCEFISPSSTSCVWWAQSRKSKGHSIEEDAQIISTNGFGGRNCPTVFEREWLASWKRALQCHLQKRLCVMHLSRKF